MRTKKKHGFFARLIATVLALVLILGNDSMITGSVVQAAASSSSTSNTTRISVHDPSIFYDSSSNSYYIYGSHLAQAKSSDLRNWSAVDTQGYTNESIYVSENVEGIYYIQNKFSGLYLDVVDGSAENGANIQQWEYNGSQAQMFKFVSTGDGYYYIMTGASNYSKCVDVDSGSSADGTNIMQWEYWGGDMQKYRVVQQADGTYAILTNASGCTSGLDVYEWSTENGGNINQWNFWGGDCQKWNLIEAEKNSGSTKASTGEPLETALASSFLWAGYNDQDCSGGYAVWAPDIIYNPDYVWNDGSKGAYMMYYSASSTYIRSCIGFAVSKSVDGPFSYVDSVVYSGFTNGDNEVTTTSSLGTKTVNTNYTNTNIPSLIEAGKLSSVRSGWFNSNGSFNNTLFPNAIDPTLVYDASGNLWMTYGSWSGGIFILQIDKATGLPIYPKSNSGQTDGYFGTRIAGGYGMSGEAPYIVYDSSNGYYYLYVTYGWLGSDGGYHVRVYRSKTINGTYTDASGSNAIYSSSSNQSKLGVKLFGNYDFSTLSTVGYKSGGHNSAFIDTDGQRYLVYHTRFDDGYEYHEVRVHQQFLNQDNWPVTAVYEYLGSTISQNGYSMDSMCGTYEFVNHGLNADTANVGMLSTKKVTLNSNGTISGDYSGTWSYTSGTYYCQMTIDGVTYKGVFFKQKDESSSHKEVMTFTLIGSDNRSIWGTKTTADTSSSTSSATPSPTAKPTATAKPAATAKPSSGSGTSARQMEALSRGLVAVKTNSGVYLSWRLLGTEDYSTKFNVYRDGVKIASNISDSTNYLDSNGSSNSSYMVRAVVNGSEANQSDTVKPWSNNYKDVPISKPSGNYTANDATVADVDGDGEYEIILKWDPSDAKDNSQSGYTSNVYVDCYEMDGTRRWRIDLGKNIRAGAHYTQFIAYDLNGDGKAEVAMKTADGTVDGKGTVIGDSSKDYRNSSGYVLDGPEYLTLFEGSTGKELVTIDYYPARGTVSSWGDNYGNRVDRFLAGVAYFDGKTPSLVVCRGYYTRSVIVSYEYKGGKLNQEWVFDTNSSGNSAYAGQGNHNLSIADVDGDGKDEVVYGSAVIDHDGTGLYATGDGHGDALHVGDFDPTHSGLEIYQVHESTASDIESIQFRDAKSGKTLWSKSLSKDIGRGLILNIDPEFYPYAALASSGNYYTANGKSITSSVSGLGMNFATYWDGDLYREGLDGTTISKWDYNNNKVVTALSGSNVHSNNGTKATPSLSGDILGDWREEVIWPTSDDTALRIYTTTNVTSEKLYTLMHDSQYRLSIAWQNVGYNQPPHTSYYIGPDMGTPSQPSLYTAGNYTLPGISGTVVTPTVAPAATAAPTAKPTTAPSATTVPTSAPTQAPSGDVTAASYVHNFTTAGKSSDFFSITGNLSTSKGSVSYNGLSLTQCLKMESSTSVSFTVASDAELTLVFNSANSSNVKVDGTKYTLSNGILTMNVKAGTHTITKADTANLFYIAVNVKGSGSTVTPTAAPTSAPTAKPTAAPTQAPTAKPTAAPTAKPTAAPTQAPTAKPTAAPTQAPSASGVAYTGSATIKGANWWATQDISKSDLLGSVDPSDVTAIKFSSNTDFFVGYNGISQYTQVSGKTEYTLTDINLAYSYYLQLAMSKNDNVNYKITWEVYTGSGSVVAPTAAPTAAPTSAPTAKPTAAPTAKPTAAPTAKPTSAPTAAPTQAPTGGDSSQSWNFKNTGFNSLGTISSNVTVDGLTLIATSAKTMSVNSNSQTVDGTTYSHCLALGGGGSTSYRAVKVPVTGSDTIKVILKSSGSSARTLVVADASGKQIGTITAGTSAALGTYNYSGDAGYVYLYSSGSGINLYKIQVDSKGSGSGSTVTPTAAPSTTATPSATAKPSATAAPTAAPSTASGDLFVSPSGKSSNSGTQNSPMDLATAVKKIAAGKTIWMMEGTYKLSSTIVIEESNSGKSGSYKSIRSYNGADVVLDFSSMSESGSNRGIVLDGDYWHFYGIDIKGAGDNGMLLSGNNNVIEMCQFYENHDSGLQLSRYQTGYDEVSEWPAYNQIINCTSYNNKDEATAENADGFAAKLTCGEGNVFDGCIAYCNSDDGWDLYAKPETGSIGVVTIKNCVAFGNGKLTDGSGSANGDMNGFKLGGSNGQCPTPHVVENSLAFNNGACGFTDNGNGGALVMKNCTSVNNGVYASKANYMCYRTSSSAKYSNLLSYSDSLKSADKFLGKMSNTVYANSSYYYISSGSFSGSAAKEGTKLSLSSSIFDSTSIPGYSSGKYATNYHEEFRNADGSVNMDGLFQVKSGSAVSSYGVGADLD